MKKLFRRSQLKEKIEQLILLLERLRLGEYLEYLANPRRVLFRTFVMGVVRGLGTVIGFSLLGALLLYILKDSFLKNLPLIGDALAEILDDAYRRVGTK